MRQIANDRNENAELRRDVPLARKPFAARSAESLSTNDRAKALGGRTLARPSCGRFMPTAETTLFPAYSARSRRLLTSNALLDNEANYCWPRRGCSGAGLIRSGKPLRF